MFVYLLRLGDTDFYKVGVSKDVQNRIADLQTATPFELRLIGFIEQSDALRVERDIHRALAGRRVRNEWFKSDHDEIVEVFQAVNAMAFVDQQLDDPTLTLSEDDDDGMMTIDDAPPPAWETSRRGTAPESLIELLYAQQGIRDRDAMRQRLRTEYGLGLDNNRFTAVKRKCEGI